MRIYKLENTIQRYAWGSRDGLSTYLGIPNPSGQPAAELWMGAHSKAPSLLVDGPTKRPLDLLIRENPEAFIGPEAVASFGPVLPFLFKALSAGMPLSIQAHPSKLKAERGFEHENQSGLPLDAPERNYRDANHKPEQAVALSRFEALCGFRPISEIIENLRLFVPEGYDRYIARLERNPSRIELSVFFYSLITARDEAKRRILDLVGLRVRRLAHTLEGGSEKGEICRWITRLLQDFPGDIGALTPLIFNYLVLEPGESFFIPPGEPHAYLSGTALEIMANSDNVVRGALTAKHIDQPELVSVLSFGSGKPELARTSKAEEGEEAFPAPAADFALSRIRVRGSLGRRAEGPEILLCAEGGVEIEAEGERLGLDRGNSAFLRADAGAYSLHGEGLLYRAYLPPRP